jgi:4-hydroxy-2-oxoheptanedioate aldolase
LRKLGKPAGILSFAGAATRTYIDWGFTFVAVGSDLSLLAGGADRLAAEFKA